MNVTALLEFAGKNSHVISWGYFDLFAVFQNLYLFIIY